jgi:phosphoribosylaminoimidazole-succinocarboxamide synthase
MNYAIESIDMSDFCRLYSGKYKKNYKVENPGTEKMLFRDRRAVNDVSFSSDSQFCQA